MSRKGYDYSDPRISPDVVKAAGGTFVIRYFSHDPKKNLSPEEAQALTAAGIDIVSNWELYETRATEGHDAGVADAKEALAQHIKCNGGTDNRRPIYFDVDSDVEPSSVAEYFAAVASGLGAGRVGVYGSTAVCRSLKASGSVTWTWRTQSTGWRGGPGQESEFNMVQQPATTIGGISADPDNAITEDFGQWRVGGGPGPETHFITSTGDTHVALVQHPSDKNRLDALVITPDNKVVHFTSKNGFQGLVSAAQEESWGAPRDGVVAGSLSATWDADGKNLEATVVAPNTQVYGRVIDTDGKVIYDWVPLQNVKAKVPLLPLAER